MLQSLAALLLLATICRIIFLHVRACFNILIHLDLSIIYLITHYNHRNLLFMIMTNTFNLPSSIRLFPARSVSFPQLNAFHSTLLTERQDLLQPYIYGYRITSFLLWKHGFPELPIISAMLVILLIPFLAPFLKEVMTKKILLYSSIFYCYHDKYP